MIHTIDTMTKVTSMLYYALDRMISIGLANGYIKAGTEDSANYHPQEAQLSEYDKRLERAIVRGLRQQQDYLFDEIDENDLSFNIGVRINNPKFAQILIDSIMPVLQEAAIHGVNFARYLIERDILGVIKADPAALLAIDWELVNTDAAAWALNYVAELVTGINETTKLRIQKEIASFVGSGEPLLSGLISRLSPMFGRNRAEMIAATEVTRAYSHGNVLAWQNSGVIQGKQWQTAKDEIVCPICGAVQGQIVAIDGEFDTPAGKVSEPPAHPRCRCWVVPVVMNDEQLANTFTREDELALLNQSGFDLFEGIRPPEGRAPTGLGQEYAQRRRIVSRIQTQIKFRDQLKRTVDNYRGQANQQWEISRARDRIAELNKAITAALNIAGDTSADWGFKSELIDGIIEYVAELTR